ncbi:hypothetical protein [Sinosporangium siamense]|uniref:Uncharacterized protein n=1 Tax=Sinosporangium siamense TaxID=1367973 RepID=A0A919V6F9_9ACTN|nr:hypothetical protein [Sinosporangium siamense]GII91966.1 hypothetical protein Ssi02_21970 [Sinosporangium siamense]
MKSTLSRDEKFQLGTAKAARRFGRRGFLGKTGAFAAAVAGVVVGVDVRPALAHGTCYPPQSTYCSGCAADSSCPSGFATCTPTYDRGCGQCPYSSGWWYTGTAPNRHRCRDCISSIFGPIPCTGAYHCGCKSTIHY